MDTKRIAYFDIETNSLNPVEKGSRVTMIGVMFEDEQSLPLLLTNADEKEMLTQFWYFVSQNPAQYVGFNCISFDWNFLYKRSICLGVKPFMKFKWSLFDIRNFIDSSFGAKGKLGEWCEAIGGEGKFNDLTGEEVIELWNKQDLDTLRRYLHQDLVMTRMLYKRLEECEVL